MSESLPFDIDMSESHYVPIDPIPSHVRRFLAPVLLQHPDGSLECRGSTFCIGPTTAVAREAIFVTARHVIEPVHENPSLRPLVLLPASAAAAQLVAVPLGSVGMAHSPNDLALLRVDMARATEPIEDHPECVRISLRFPFLGENTLALGYPEQTVLSPSLFDSRLLAAHGIVEEVHNDDPDPLLAGLIHPRFMVTGRYEGGMSGGPVTDEAGNGVIGVVSRGMTPVDDSPPYGIAQSVACLIELGISLHADDGTENHWTFPQLKSAGLIQLIGEGTAGIMTTFHDDTGIHITWS